MLIRIMSLEEINHRNDFPVAYRAWYNLGTGKYLTPDQTNIRPEEVALFEQYGTGKTNANSTVPVIGTRCLNPCATLILYNRKTKTAIMNHRPILSILVRPMHEEYKYLLSQIRTNPEDQVDIHIIGGAYSKGDGKFLVQELTKLLAEILDTPNTGIKTFDVYDKLKPTGVAFDTRNSRLIRDTDLVRTEREGFDNRDWFFEYANWGQNRHQSFDGTTPKYQKSRSFP